MLSKYSNCTRLLKIKNKLKISWSVKYLSFKPPKGQAFFKGGAFIGEREVGLFETREASLGNLALF